MVSAVLDMVFLILWASLDISILEVLVLDMVSGGVRVICDGLRTS